MVNSLFWSWFDSEAAPRLALREISFRKIFRYLDSLDGPLLIVETGCARMAGNWGGDGQSTVLFDRYLTTAAAGSYGYTIDLDPKATRLCRGLVSDRIRVLTGDSIAALAAINRELVQGGRQVDLLYLDSYDVDWNHPVPSAVHHLKELVSIRPALTAKTLVVVDDAPSSCRVVANAKQQYDLVSRPEVGGKGKFVAEYAEQLGAALQFAHYQVAWLGMNGEAIGATAKFAEATPSPQALTQEQIATLDIAQLIVQAENLRAQAGTYAAIALYRAWLAAASADGAANGAAYAACFNLARLLDESGDGAAALSVYAEALQRKPDFAPALLNLGYVQVKQGRPEEALQSWQRLVDLPAADADADLLVRAYNAMGKESAALGRYDEARRCFTRSLALRAEQPDIVARLRALMQAEIAWPRHVPQASDEAGTVPAAAAPVAVWTPGYRSASCRRAAEELTGRRYDYRRIGHDSRALSFRADGTIGEGAAACEAVWNLREDGQHVLLDIYSNSSITCSLLRDAKGIWRGKWLVFEQMPVELHPLAALGQAAGAPDTPARAIHAQLSGQLGNCLRNIASVKILADEIGAQWDIDLAQSRAPKHVNEVVSRLFPDRVRSYDKDSYSGFPEAALLEFTDIYGTNSHPLVEATVAAVPSFDFGIRHIYAFRPQWLSDEEYARRKKRFFADLLWPQSWLDEAARFFAEIPGGAQACLACHVRYTDNLQDYLKAKLGLNTSLPSFAERLGREGGRPILLCTDSAEAREKLGAALPAAQLLTPPPCPTEPALWQPLFEMLLLSYCNHVIGSFSSTFSYEACFFRGSDLELFRDGQWRRYAIAAMAA